MRLKFLFFPIMLIISISVIIGYIWPEISNIKTLNEDKLSSENDLKAIQDKQNAIELLGTQITNDNTGAQLVNNYLPSAKSEERIISGVNFLAADSGVSLINISIKDAAADTSASSASVVNPIANIVTGGTAAADAATGTTNGTTAPSAATKDTVQYSEATIAISGTYDKIKLFLDQIQKMPIYNSIKTLTISTQSADSKSDNSQQQSDPSVLSGNIVVDFAYMGSVKIDNQKIANFNPNLDNDTISTLKQYISQKAPGADSAGDDNGKANPFLP